MNIPFADAHLHINSVKGVKASYVAAKFKEVGGWFLAPVSGSPWDYDIDLSPDVTAAYLKVVEHHTAECRELAEHGLKVACIAGFYPGDVDRLAAVLSPATILEVGYKVIDYVAELCRKGLLDGIGEVGRQHYRTTPERVVVSELIMERALLAANDNRCVVHLHLEDIGRDTVTLTNEVIKVLGLKPSPKIVFHHARTDMIPEAARLGYSATLFGRPELLEAAFSRLEPNFMVESDFPGMDSERVISPWSIAANEKRVAERLGLGPEYLYKLNVDNVVRTYGVTPP